MHQRYKLGALSRHPAWVAVKLADGWLQVGNLMIEAAECRGRIRTPAHQRHNVEERLGIKTGDGWAAGSDDWFVTTHIMDKELLWLATAVGGEDMKDMIDGLQLTPEVYVKSYGPIMELMARNPHLQIKGVVSDGTWIYNPKLRELFPDHHISRLHEVAGKVVVIGTAAELGMHAQIGFATGNPDRKAAFEAGLYDVEIAVRFIDIGGMEAAREEYQ